jgi:hypothetical protein
MPYYARVFFIAFASATASCSSERPQKESDRKEISQYYSCVRTSFASQLPTMVDRNMAIDQAFKVCQTEESKLQTFENTLSEVSNAAISAHGNTLKKNSCGGRTCAVSRQSSLVLVADRQRSDDARGSRRDPKRGQGAVSEELGRLESVGEAGSGALRQVADHKGVPLTQPFDGPLAPLRRGFSLAFWRRAISRSTALRTRPVRGGSGSARAQQCRDDLARRPIATQR